MTRCCSITSAVLLPNHRCAASRILSQRYGRRAAWYAIRRAFGDHSGARVRGMAARSLYERSYRPNIVIRSLLNVYEGLKP